MRLEVCVEPASVVDQIVTLLNRALAADGRIVFLWDGETVPRYVPGNDRIN